MKGTGRYSKRRVHNSNLEARTAAYEEALRKCKGKQVGGFHAPGSNKK